MKSEKKIYTSIHRFPIFTTENRWKAKNKSLHSQVVLFLPLKIGEEQKTKVYTAKLPYFYHWKSVRSKTQKSTQPSCPIFTMKTGKTKKQKRSTRRSADFLFLPLKIGEKQKTKVYTAKLSYFYHWKSGKSKKQKSTQPSCPIFTTENRGRAKNKKGPHVEWKMQISGLPWGLLVMWAS